MFEFTAYGKNFTIKLSPVFPPTQYGIRCTYEHSGEEKYLYESGFFTSEITTRAATDEMFAKAIQEIDAELQKAFGKVPSAGPEFGVERVEWLIKSKLAVENDKLVYKAA